MFVFPGGAFTLAARCIVLLALRLDLCQGQYCPQRTLTSWRSPRGGGIPGFDHTGHSSSRGVVVRTYIYTSYKQGSVGSPRINLGCRTLQNFLGLLPATWLNRIIFGFAELRIHIRNSLPREFISGIHCRVNSFQEFAASACSSKQVNSYQEFTACAFLGDHGACLAHQFAQAPF